MLESIRSLRSKKNEARPGAAERTGEACREHGYFKGSTGGPNLISNRSLNTQPEKR